MTAIVVMPVTYEAYGIACNATMHPDVAARTVTVDNTGTSNLGAAGSYNVGARRVLAGEADWLLTLSPTVRFGPAGGRDMLDYLDTVDPSSTWVVEAEAPVGWHWLAWSRSMFERVGLWDENFWPVYGEDADIAHRVEIAAREDELTDPWDVFPGDCWLMMQGYSAHLAGIAEPQTAIWDYYVEKWGGRSGHELWDRPFGGRPLDYWPTPAPR